MPYITVRENKAKWWITVQGLNYNEVTREVLAALTGQRALLGETPLREAE